MEKLPIYKALVNEEDTGIFAISLVDFPAVESNFLYFSEDKKEIKFAVQNEEKRIVRGLVMECDKPIYRISPKGEEYYIVFDEPTIRFMAEKYLRDGLQNSVDLFHSGELVKDINMVQWFISDKEHGINPEGFEDIADHSLFAEFKVNNDEVWEKIKAGDVMGFSLAGCFEVVPEQKENILEEIGALLEKINNKITNQL